MSATREGATISSINDFVENGAILVTPGGNGGGLVGFVAANTLGIENSYASGAITGVGQNVGGLVGDNHAAISTSYANPVCTSNCAALIASIDVQDTNVTVGGLVGANESDGGKVSESFSAPVEGSNTSAISGSGSSSVGGLVGYNHGSIADSYSYPTYSISCQGCAALVFGGNSSQVGGLVGQEDSQAQIADSYSSGSVYGGSSNVGGSIGLDDGLNNGSKNNVYWDTDTSGTNYAAGNNGWGGPQGN